MLRTESPCHPLRSWPLLPLTRERSQSQNVCSNNMYLTDIRLFICCSFQDETELLTVLLYRQQLRFSTAGQVISRLLHIAILMDCYIGRLSAYLRNTSYNCCSKSRRMAVSCSGVRIGVQLSRVISFPWNMTVSVSFL